MNPLNHFIRKIPSRDIWSKGSWYDSAGRLRPTVTCASCKKQSSREASIIVPKGTPLNTATPIQSRPRIMSMHRPKKYASKSPEGNIYLCPTCSHNLPTLRAIRGERPEYTPRFMDNNMLKEINNLTRTPTPIQFTPVSLPVEEPHIITSQQKDQLRKAFVKRYNNYKNRDNDE